MKQSLPLDLPARLPLPCGTASLAFPRRHISTSPGAPSISGRWASCRGSAPCRTADGGGGLQLVSTLVTPVICLQGSFLGVRQEFPPLEGIKCHIKLCGVRGSRPTQSGRERQPRFIIMAPLKLHYLNIQNSAFKQFIVIGAPATLWNS